MSVWLLELRRSPALLLSPVLVAAGLLAVFGDRTWIGLWAETEGAAGKASILLAPLAAAIGAVTSSTWVTSGAAALRATAARPLSRQQFMRVSPLLLVTATAYVLCSVVAWIVSWTAAGPWIPRTGYVALGLFFVLFATSFGYLVGLLVPSLIVAPFAAMLGMLLGQAFLRVPLGDFVQGAVPLRALAVVALGAVAATLLATFLPPRVPAAVAWRRWTSARTYAAAAMSYVIVGALVAVVALTRGPAQIPRQPNPSCAGVTPKICLWPDHESLRGDLDMAVTRLRDQLPSGVRLPVDIRERGLGGTYGMTMPPLWFAYATIASQVMEASFNPGCLPPEGRARDAYVRNYHELLVWIILVENGGPRPKGLGGGPPDVDIAAIEALLSQSAQTQHTWAAERVAAVSATCP